MGNRTVVILYNDQTSDWSKDPDLGKKIMLGVNDAFMSSESPGPRGDLGYGRVVECAHADTQTLAIIDGYQYKPIAYAWWYAGQTTDITKIELLKSWADKMGYRLVKKPEKK